MSEPVLTLAVVRYTSDDIHKDHVNVTSVDLGEKNRGNDQEFEDEYVSERIVSEQHDYGNTELLPTEVEEEDHFGQPWEDRSDATVTFLITLTKPPSGAGLGMMLDGTDEGLEVRGILPGSLAEYAVAETGEQLAEGDIIYQVNGQDEDLALAMSEPVLTLAVVRYASDDIHQDRENATAMDRS